MFELLNRLNHTPSVSHNDLDAKLRHKQKINAILTQPGNRRVNVDIPKEYS
jgi:hypothetical protein